MALHVGPMTFKISLLRDSSSFWKSRVSTHRNSGVCLNLWMGIAVWTCKSVSDSPRQLRLQKWLFTSSLHSTLQGAPLEVVQAEL